MEYNITYFFTAYTCITALIYAIVRILQQLWNFL